MNRSTDFKTSTLIDKLSMVCFSTPSTSAQNNKKRQSCSSERQQWATAVSDSLDHSSSHHLGYLNPHDSFGFAYWAKNFRLSIKPNNVTKRTWLSQWKQQAQRVRNDLCEEENEKSTCKSLLSRTLTKLHLTSGLKTADFRNPDVVPASWAKYTAVPA